MGALRRSLGGGAVPWFKPDTTPLTPNCRTQPQPPTPRSTKTGKFFASEAAPNADYVARLEATGGIVAAKSKARQPMNFSSSAAPRAPMHGPGGADAAAAAGGSNKSAAQRLKEQLAGKRGGAAAVGEEDGDATAAAAAAAAGGADGKGEGESGAAAGGEEPVAKKARVSLAEDGDGDAAMREQCEGESNGAGTSGVGTSMESIGDDEVRFFSPYILASGGG